MKPVKSRAVCDFFYILFWANVFAAVLVITLMVFTISVAKKGGAGLYVALLTQTMVLSLVVIQAMFTYLMCERALIPEAK